MLAKQLRFNFLSFYNMISAIRKNEALQHSAVFIDSFEQEYMYRLKMGKTQFNQQSALQEETFFTGRSRNHFNNAKIQC